MRKEWLSIASVWLLVAIGAILVIFNLEQGEAIRSFGVLAAGSLALVSLVHLFSSHSEGIVRRLIFAAGGAYAILAVAGLYILLLG